MTPKDYEEFSTLIAGVHAFYKRDFSEFSLGVWWRALRAYDLRAVNDAIGRHSVNPDSGQFMPYPADIEKMLGGSTQDAGLVAWSKVDRAVREVGTWHSVVFDDPTIHRVITDMGGWVHVGGQQDKDWPFVKNEFVNRYRGFRMRSETPDHLPVLIGAAEAANAKAGFHVLTPRLIGNPAEARAVAASGTDKPLLQVTAADVADSLARGAAKRIGRTT